jgi:hypothetical protein
VKKLQEQGDGLPEFVWLALHEEQSRRRRRDGEASRAVSVEEGAQ